MSSFVARPATDPTPVEEPIVSPGFFPDVDPAALRKTLRVTEAVTPERWREALIAGMISVINDLGSWASAKADAGIASLADVPGPLGTIVEIDGQNRLVALYTRAVACLARAEVTERMRDFDLTPAGKRDAGEAPDAVDDWRRDARHAVRDILGRGRTTIELI
jgi:hypothetical protein